MIVDNSVIDALTGDELAALEDRKPFDFCRSFRDRTGLGLNEAHDVYKELRHKFGFTTKE